MALWHSGCSLTAHYTLKAWTKENPPKIRPGINPAHNPAGPGVDCAASENILLFLTWSAPLRARGHSGAEICSHNRGAIRTQISWFNFFAHGQKVPLKPGLSQAWNNLTGPGRDLRSCLIFRFWAGKRFRFIKGQISVLSPTITSWNTWRRNFLFLA